MIRVVAGLAVTWFLTTTPLCGQEPGEGRTDPSEAAARLVRVVDDLTGRPLPGVALRLEGHDTVWRTNADGSTWLDVPGPGRVIRASGPGYQTARVPVPPGSAALEIRLTPIPIRLDELNARIRKRVPAGTGYRIDLSRATHPGALIDWLRALPGVEVQRRGGNGAATTVSMRGSRPSGVLVLLDGVPLNDPLTGVADLSTVSLETLGTAEVTMGAVPGHPGATAGLIRLQSQDGAVGMAVAVDAGSFGYGGVRGSGSHPIGPLRLGWSGAAEGASNQFEFVNRLRAPHEAEARTNADFRRFGGMLSLGTATWSARIRLDEGERGTPGHMGTHLWDEARLADRSVRLGGRAVLGATGLEIGVTRRTERYEDARTGQSDTLTLSQARAGLSVDLYAGARLDVLASVEGARGEALGRTPARWAVDGRVGRVLAWRWLEASPVLAVSVSDAGSNVSPGLTLSTVTSGGRVWLRGARNFRRPGLADLYYGATRGVRANPDLAPERVVLDAEVGWDHRLGPGLVRASLFWRRTHDAIVWLPSSTAVWSPRNFPRLEAAGAELRWAGAIPRLDWAVSGSVQHSRLVNDERDSRVPYRAGISLRGEVAPHAGPISVRAALAVHGTRPTTLSGSHALPVYARADLRADLRLRLGGTSGRVYVSVDNVFDADYELVELFPEPGRSVRFGIQVAPAATARLQRQGPRGSLAAPDDGRPAQRPPTNLSGGIE